MVVCIDELSIVDVDEYGTQPPLELLRQMVDSGGFYDLQKQFFKRVEDTQVDYIRLYNILFPSQEHS